MINSGLFTSETDMWATPQAFFNELDNEFQFETDVCAVAENAKCKNFYSPADDSLTKNWEGMCYMNPPYGREIGDWVAKAHETAKSGAGSVVCLVPARTDTAWWHDHVMEATEIRLVRGRLKFNDKAGSAPFPSAVVVFRSGEVGGVPRLSVMERM